MPAVRVRRHDPRQRRSTGRTAPGSCSSRSPTSTTRCARSAARSSCGAATGCDEVAARRATRSARTRVHVSDDVSGYAPASARRPRAAARSPASRSSVRPGITVVAARRDHAAGDAGRPLQGVHAVLPALVRGAASPRGAARRSRVDAARRHRRRAPARSSTTWSTATAPRTSCPGGASAGHAAARGVDRVGLRGYADHHDDLPGDATSRLSPYLHFGCLSPLEVLRAAGHHQGEGADAFVRQLCWRDFYAQVLAARPDAAWSRLRRPRRPLARRPRRAAQAWKEGRTGYPVVDAGMRQLPHEGWMHNRARLIVASFLTKDLYARLARRRPPLPRPARRRRRRQQQPQLAVGRRHGHRHQPAPRVQPHRAGPALRSRRRLRAALRARARARSRTAPSTTPTPRSAAPTTTPTRSSTTRKPSPSTRNATPAPDRTCVEVAAYPRLRRRNVIGRGLARRRWCRRTCGAGGGCGTRRRRRSSVPYSETIESPVSQ